MGVIVIIFAIMSYFYVYITPTGYEEQPGDTIGLVGEDEDKKEYIEGAPPQRTADATSPGGGSYQGGDPPTAEADLK